MGGDSGPAAPLSPKKQLSGHPRYSRARAAAQPPPGPRSRFIPPLNQRDERGLAPHLASNLADHRELCPLLRLGEHVALPGRGHPALRAQGELVEIGEFCRLVEPALDRILAL